MKKIKYALIWALSLSISVLLTTPINALAITGNISDDLETLDVTNASVSLSDELEVLPADSSDALVSEPVLQAEIDADSVAESVEDFELPLEDQLNPSVSDDDFLDNIETIPDPTEAPVIPDEIETQINNELPEEDPLIEYEPEIVAEALNNNPSTGEGFSISSIGAIAVMAVLSVVMTVRRRSHR